MIVFSAFLETEKVLWKGQPLFCLMSTLRSTHRICTGPAQHQAQQPARLRHRTLDSKHSAQHPVEQEAAKFANEGLTFEK